MKKRRMEINSIFSLTEEMVKNNGEDSFCYRIDEDDFLIASFDGLGGSGAKKYENYSGKTGAYIASRAVSGVVELWFDNSKDEKELSDYIQNALNVCKKYADNKTSRIRGSLSKAFPTTASVITGKMNGNKVDVTCYWAGDSRCYILDSDGLHQLTADDLDGQDAMSNLTNDGVMTNVINASVPFEIHNKHFSFDRPCILLTATDGCFGYLESPMEFEYLLTNSLVKAKNIHEWKIALNERMHDVTGDDYTLCVVICGFNDFGEIKANYVKRNAYVADTYINQTTDVNDMWEIYKKDYSIYL